MWFFRQRTTYGLQNIVVVTIPHRDRAKKNISLDTYYVWRHNGVRANNKEKEIRQSQIDRMRRNNDDILNSCHFAWRTASNDTSNISGWSETDDMSLFKMTNEFEKEKIQFLSRNHVEKEV